MEPEGPAVLREQAHYGPKLLLHHARYVGARFKKVFEIGGRKDQHLPGAVVSKVIVALPRGEHASPVLEVGELALGLLREQIVSNPDGQLAILVKLLDNLVVLRIVLKAAPGVDRAGDPQSVELTHEVAAGVDLVFRRQLRALRECGI